VASSLRSFRERDRAGVLELSRRALNRAEEQVGNPLWSSREELESELSDWDVSPEETLFVEEEDGEVVGFGGVEISRGWEHADLFGPLVAPRFRGQKFGSELLRASLEQAARHGTRLVIASVGARNARGRMLLEQAGFTTRGSAKAVFRLSRADHKPAEQGPTGVDVRRGVPRDLEAAIALYHECFPAGVFPDESWRAALERGTVWLAEAGGRPIAFLDIDPSDRWAYHIGVGESERARGLGRFLLSRALDDYWATHADETVGLSVEADNLPALRLLRRQGFAPWLVLQSYDLRL
jgi:ribosomal protein S18 acetylase RimI-like enzyme